VGLFSFTSEGDTLSSPIPESGFYNIVFSHPRTQAEARILVASIAYEWDHYNARIALRVTDISTGEELFVPAKDVLKLDDAPNMRLQIILAENRVKAEQENLAEIKGLCKHEYLEVFVNDRGRKCRDCGTIVIPPD
jgi:hypothetical protein